MPSLALVVALWLPGCGARSELGSSTHGGMAGSLPTLNGGATGAGTAGQGGGGAIAAGSGGSSGAPALPCAAIEAPGGFVAINDNLTDGASLNDVVAVDGHVLVGWRTYSSVELPLTMHYRVMPVREDGVPLDSSHEFASLTSSGPTGRIALAAGNGRVGGVAWVGTDGPLVLQQLDALGKSHTSIPVPDVYRYGDFLQTTLTGFDFIGNPKQSASSVYSGELVAVSESGQTTSAPLADIGRVVARRALRDGSFVLAFNADHEGADIGLELRVQHLSATGAELAPPATVLVDKHFGVIKNSFSGYRIALTEVDTGLLMAWTVGAPDHAQAGAIFTQRLTVNGSPLSSPYPLVAPVVGTPTSLGSPVQALDLLTVEGGVLLAWAAPSKFSASPLVIARLLGPTGEGAGEPVNLGSFPLVDGLRLVSTPSGALVALDAIDTPGTPDGVLVRPLRCTH